MLKIVVYGRGWGSELVANYLESELNIIEVVRVVTWREWRDVTQSEVLADIERDLARYMDEVDVVVLGDYELSRMASELRRRHPQQKFVGMGVNYQQVLNTRNYPRNVVILMDENEALEEIKLEMRSELEYSTLIIPDCSGWEELINQDMLTTEILRADLAWDFVVQLPDVAGRRRRRGVSSGHACVAEAKIEMPRMPSMKTGMRMSDRQKIAQAIQKLNCAQKEAAVSEKETKEESRRLVMELARRDDLEMIKPDVVLILNTSFWEIRENLEEVFGWDVRVLDFREKLLRDTCAALKLKGVDGKSGR